MTDAWKRRLDVLVSAIESENWARARTALKSIQRAIPGAPGVRLEEDRLKWLEGQMGRIQAFVDSAGDRDVQGLARMLSLLIHTRKEYDEERALREAATPAQSDAEAEADLIDDVVRLPIAQAARVVRTVFERRPELAPLLGKGG